MRQHGGNLHATILANQSTTKCMQRVEDDDDDDVRNDNDDDGSLMAQKVVRQRGGRWRHGMRHTPINWR